MRDALKAELLKTRSGYAMLGVFGYAVLCPVLLLWSGPSLSALGDRTDEAATHLVFGLVAASTIAGMFLGSYVVTREYYYKSILRSLLLQGRRNVFAAKVLASAAGGALCGLLGVACWTAVTWFALRSEGRHLTLDPTTWGIGLGTVLGGALAGIWGAAVGWIVRSYYLAMTLVLVLPMVVELPLLLNAPAVERFLPGGALAGLARVPVDGLFPAPVSAAVMVAWTAAALVTARRLVRRREAE
ncbi:hypothetical protein AB0E96_26090 [Kitasatospora sp. NPDC036755]|uniref:hypothetical protein n=1 Tax=Kitasatospora sp. NPDC036755 TaxID=3154600 RepID=UPI0033FD2429